MGFYKLYLSVSLLRLISRLLWVGFWWNFVEMLELRSERLYQNLIKISLWCHSWLFFMVLLFWHVGERVYCETNIASVDLTCSSAGERELWYKTHRQKMFRGDAVSQTVTQKTAILSPKYRLLQVSKSTMFCCTRALPQPQGSVLDILNIFQR